MSDISNQNAERMIAEAKRFQSEVIELRQDIIKQNAKIATLTIEVADLKQAQIMATVQSQIALTGRGGTG
jgi:hypothetical protein